MLAPITRVPRGWRIAAALVVAGLVPLAFLGPGTDLDAGAVIASARLIRRGHYQPSRPPGAPVHEAIVALTEGIGGPALSNLATLAAACGAVVLLVALLRTGSVPRPWLAAGVFAANPWFLVAATSTVDFPFALAAILGGVLAMRARRPWLAGVLFGVAIGCRSSSVVALAAALAAELFDRKAHKRLQFQSAALALIIGILCYLPALAGSGGSLAFAQNDFRTAGPFTMLGRAAAKDLYFVGPAAALVLMLALPELWRVRDAWNDQYLVRLGVLIVVLEQLLFIRFPWKMGHLLPLWAGAVMVLGWALRNRPRLLVALVVAQLAYGAFNVQLLEPDRPNDSSGARVVFELRWGVVVTDTACRLDDTGAWRTNERSRMEAVWNCAKPFGDGP